MTGSVKNWIDAASRSGLVCQDYMRKIAAAERKSEVFRVLCDANGGRWLFDLHNKGVKLPVDEFVGEYAAFLGGKRVVDYPEGYTSKMYCREDGIEITADTTLVYLLECEGMRITLPDNSYPTLILSRGSSAIIHPGKNARLNIELYGDTEYTVTGMTHVTETRHE